MSLATDICHRKMLYQLLFGKVKIEMADKSKEQQLIFNSFLGYFEVDKMQFGKILVCFVLCHHLRLKKFNRENGKWTKTATDASLICAIVITH